MVVNIALVHELYGTAYTFRHFWPMYHFFDHSNPYRLLVDHRLFKHIHISMKFQIGGAPRGQGSGASAGGGGAADEVALKGRAGKAANLKSTANDS